MGEDQLDWEPTAFRLLPLRPEAPSSLIGFPTTLPLLIGRESEVQAVLAQLREPTCRLLTLTGPGGMGKTRLALAAAAEVARDFVDRAVYVPLETTRDPFSVIPTIALALGVRDAPADRCARSLAMPCAAPAGEMRNLPYSGSFANGIR